MLESVYIILILVGVVMSLKAWDDEAWPLCMISLLPWIIVFATSAYITQSYATDADTGMEFGIQALAIGFIFINIVLAIVFKAEYTFRRDMPPVR